MLLQCFNHQAEFLADISSRNLALIGGYGCGKTKALALKLIILAQLNPNCIGIALSPTYKMATQNLIPTMEDEMRCLNIKYVFNKTELKFTIKVPGGETVIYVLAAEHYKRAAGLNAAFFGFDEADLLSADVFSAAWKMMSSRLRKGKVFQGVAVSTPEGFRGCWRHWVKDLEDDAKLDWRNGGPRRMIKASTYDNFTLPPEYIADLESQYPEALIKAYLHGEFVNLKGTPVYYRYLAAYDSQAEDGTVVEGNWTNKTIDSFPHSAIHVGLDFGKNNNPCEINVFSGETRYVVDELYGLRNTDECIEALKEKYEGREIHFYPDALNLEAVHNYEKNFGAARVHSDSGNPPIGFRVACLHWSIQNPITKVRHLKVNPEKCKRLDLGLQQQVFDDKMKPDKSAGIEHAVDAEGYLHVQRFPVDESAFDRQALRY
jgi:hypothetical protein